MNLLATTLDGLLGLTLLWLAWCTLSASGLFRAIVLFIAFGLLMALVWLRLDAPDIALAEAAVGAGLTGVLLLTALGDPQRREHSPASHTPTKRTAYHYLLHGTLLLGSLALLMMVGAALLSLPGETTRLAGIVAGQLDQAAAAHPVTAVLLDFRAWDTLIEIAVLLVAVVAAWSLGAIPPAPPGKALAGQEVLQGLVRPLTPLAVLVAGYLVWRGGHAPGGAFQAGTLLAAAGILLLLAGLVRPFNGTRVAWRLLLSAGLLLFVLVAFATLAAGGVLDYPSGLGYRLIVLIELGLSVSIGLTFMALFSGEGRREPT
jgi:multisubunit Na+/H+ antiporter MnhB subunit